MLGITPFNQLTKNLQILLIINAVVFGISILASLLGLDLIKYLLYSLCLVPEKSLQVWRMLTYAFVHFEPMHFLFNMLLLWMFGDEVSKKMGEQRFLIFYLSAAFVSGLFSVPFYLLSNSTVSILGASGALFSVMYAYMYFFPERTIYIFMLIPMKIKYAIPLFALIDLMMIKSGDGIAHLVHLGGFLAGVAYFMIFASNGRLSRKSFSWDAYGNRQFKKSKRGDFFSLLKDKLNFKSKENFKSEEIDDEENLDEVLKKVSSSGMKGLTIKEKEFLKEYVRKEKIRKEKEDNVIDINDYK